jgi:putative lipoprotein (rSAM/lipoprotein system)
MITYKTKLLKLSNSLIILLLSALGFISACKHKSSKYGIVAEYGAPQAKFIIKGTVESEDSSKIIPNIKISLDNNNVYSDINGKFQLEKTDSPENNAPIISLQDIDGPINREFLSQDYMVDFHGIPFTGGDGKWNKGEALKEVHIKLKPKN